MIITSRTKWCLCITSLIPSQLSAQGSPGVPSLEYLGIGYNAITGNPRGTESSNIDPGFRASVIKLVNDQNVLTVDTDFMVPIGTELRYITSCEYSSRALEISSSSSYQRELQRSVQSTFSKSTNERYQRDESGSSKGSGGFFGIGASASTKFKKSESSEISEDKFFSGSESYREFVKQEQETEITSFESQGVCTEFEASLKKYHRHELHESFIQGLTMLPVPYKKDNESHVTAYSDFISIYGTHYTNRVSLGARTVFTSSMSRSSVKDLQNEDIDIASSYKFRSAQKISSSSENSKSSSGGFNLGFISGGGGSSNTVAVSNYQDSEVAVTGSESTNIQLETERRVAEKIETTKEFNVGGLPATGGEWKEWARSVRENPMPISYDITPLWSLLDDPCAAKSLFNAIVDIYNLDIIGIVDAPDVGSGISRANSEPAVSYSETDIFGRYTYTSGPITRYTNNSTMTSLITYNVTLQDTFKGAVSPLFVTMINGGIGPEGDEDDLNSVPFLQKGIVGDIGSVYEDTNNSNEENMSLTIAEKSFSSFSWRSKTVGEKLSLGVLSKTASKDTDATEGLNSFSYISIPSLDSSNKAKVGVINPDGTQARKRSFVPLGYSVERDGFGVWKIIFDNEFEKPPTLIAQPTWISSPEDMPKSNAQVSVAVRECTTKNCTIYLGCKHFKGFYDPDSTHSDIWHNIIPIEKEDAYIKNHLGLSFLAIDGNFTTSSVIHGTVRDDIFFNEGTFNGQGWTALRKRSKRMKENITWAENENVKQLSFEQNFLSIEIEFDTPFLETPSLVVTPYFGLEAKQHRSEQWQEKFLGSNPFRDVTVYNDEQKSIGKVKIEPFAYVEYISSRRALVKVGIIDSWGLLRWGSRLSHRLSFSFVAVGPVSNENIVQDDEETNDGLICSSPPSTSPPMAGKGRRGERKSNGNGNLSQAPSPSPPPPRVSGVREQSGAFAMDAFMVVGPLILGLSLFMVM